MKKIKMAAVIAAAMSVNLLFVGAATTEDSTGYNQALVNVCDYGAVPNDGKDDTAAFTTALKSPATVYVPPGEYIISESLVLNYGSLIGAGVDKTVIIADIENDRDPILWVGGNTQVRDLTVKFADHCITGTEIAGERAGIVTTAAGTRRFCRSGSIRNVKIQNVGTGIYAPLTSVVRKIFPSMTSNSGDATAFSASFSEITVLDFSYRGFDMQPETRTGNVYRNIYLSSGKYEANAGFYMNWEESEFLLEGLTIADSKIKSPVRLNNQYAASITNITFINTELTQDNTGFIYLDQVGVHIGGLTFINSAPKGKRQSFIRLGDAMYRSFTYDNSGYLYVNNLNILNSDVTVDPDPEQFMVARRSGGLNEFTVKIDNYRIEAPAELKAQYEEFRADIDKDAKLIVKGRDY